MGVSLKDCYTDKDGVLRTRKSDGWIPCEDRMPDKSGAYLVTAKIMAHSKELNRYITIVTLYKVAIDEVSTKFEWSIDGVVAWMELPEVYMEDL